MQALTELNDGADKAHCLPVITQTGSHNGSLTLPCLRVTIKTRVYILAVSLVVFLGLCAVDKRQKLRVLNPRFGWFMDMRCHKPHLTGTCFCSDVLCCGCGGMMLSSQFSSELVMCIQCCIVSCERKASNTGCIKTSGHLFFDNYSETLQYIVAYLKNLGRILL